MSGGASDAPPLAGRYALGPVIGTGPAVTAHRAHDTVLGRVVTVRLIGDEVAAGQSRWQRDRVRDLARLHHPGVIALRDGGVDGGRPFAVTDPVDGPTLADRLRQGPLPAAEVRRLGVQLAEALAHVHGAGVVHQELAAHTVLLAADGSARLAGFGLVVGAPGEPAAGEPDSTAGGADRVEGVESDSGMGRDPGHAASPGADRVAGREVPPQAGAASGFGASAATADGDVRALGLLLLAALGEPAVPAVPRPARRSARHGELTAVLWAMAAPAAADRPTAAAAAGALRAVVVEPAVPPAAVASDAMSSAGQAARLAPARGPGDAVPVPDAAVEGGAGRAADRAVEGDAARVPDRTGPANSPAGRSGAIAIAAADRAAAVPGEAPRGSTVPVRDPAGMGIATPRRSRASRHGRGFLAGRPRVAAGLGGLLAARLPGPRVVVALVVLVSAAAVAVLAGGRGADPVAVALPSIAAPAGSGASIPPAEIRAPEPLPEPVAPVESVPVRVLPAAKVRPAPPVVGSTTASGAVRRTSAGTRVTAADGADRRSRRAAARATRQAERRHDREQRSGSDD